MLKPLLIPRPLTAALGLIATVSGRQATATVKRTPLRTFDVPETR